MRSENPPATRQQPGNGVLNLTNRERQALAPPPDLTVSEWADNHRVLLAKTSREPGPWRTSRTPYLRAVMDAYNLPHVRHIVLMFGTQSGKTEGLILNTLGYIISEDPYSTLLVYPSSDDARSVSRNRIQPMIEASPVLRSKKPLAEDSYQLSEMSFPGMTLYLAGSNSPTPLSQKPCRNVLRDEIDKYPPVAGGRDADPLSLSEERSKSFWDIRKIIDVSSPTVEQGNVLRQIRSCDVVYQYHVSCPSCNKLQRLVFKQIKFDNQRDLSRAKRIRVAKKSAVYICEHCEAEIRDKDREWILSEDNGAKWISDDAEAPEKPEKVGFILSSLYSPWLTWGDVVAKFLEAHLSGDPQKLMNFKNAWLAEPWIDRVEPKQEAEILSHRTELPPLVVPKEAVALTAGIDTGQGGFWYVVRAWARDLTSWLIDYGFLLTWEDVHSLVFENIYEREGPEGGFMRIFRAGLDIGGTVTKEGISATEAAYQWLRAHGQRVVFGVKGMSRPMGKRLKLSVIDTMPGRSKARIPGGLVLWNVDTSLLKDLFHWRLQVKPGDPQALYLHRETGVDYARHIMAEEKRRNRRGIFEWVQVSRNNHLLDCEVYAAAMADAECWGGIRVVSGSGQQGQRQKRRIISEGIK